jgi:hypothetical protein
LLMATRHVVINMMAGEGYAKGSARYDKATVDKVAAALDHARQLLQSSAPVHPRAVVPREQRVVVRHEKRVAVAKRDADFQAFMGSMLSPPARRRGKRSS